MTDSDKVAAALAGMRERNDQWIASMALTEASVNDSPFGDLRRALAAVEAVLAIHVRQEKPIRSWSPCEYHAYDPATGNQVSLRQMRDCPDCAALATDVWLCASCRNLCPDDDKWPCATYLAVSRALLGEEPSPGSE